MKPRWRVVDGGVILDGNRTELAPVRRLLLPTLAFFALVACKAGLSSWAPETDTAAADDTGSTDSSDSDDASVIDTDEVPAGVPPSLDSFVVSEVAGDL